MIRGSSARQREDYLKSLDSEGIKKLVSSGGTEKDYLKNQLMSAAMRTNDPKQLEKLSEAGFDTGKAESLMKMAPHLDKSGAVVPPTGAAIPTGDAAAKIAAEKAQSQSSKSEEAKQSVPQKVDISAEPLLVEVRINDENGKQIQEMQRTLVQFKQKLEEITGNKTPPVISK
jgi:hypothetical protein